MNDLMKWALIVGGGYFVLKSMGIDLLSQFDVGSIGVDTSGGTNVNDSSGGSNNVGNNIVTTDVVQLMEDRARQGASNNEGWLKGYNGTLNWDQWGWIYKQVRGVKAISPEDAGFDKDRNFKITASEWWSFASKGGLSGIAGQGGIYGNIQSGGPTWFEAVNKGWVN